jgi:hypothetical protein
VVFRQKDGLSCSRHRFGRTVVGRERRTVGKRPGYIDIPRPINGDILSHIIAGPTSPEQPPQLTGTIKFRKEDVTATGRIEHPITEPGAQGKTTGHVSVALGIYLNGVTVV